MASDCCRLKPLKHIDAFPTHIEAHACPETGRNEQDDQLALCFLLFSGSSVRDFENLSRMLLETRKRLEKLQGRDFVNVAPWIILKDLLGLSIS